MKKIKTYKVFNESLKDKLKGKTDEDVLKILHGLNAFQKIEKIKEYNLDKKYYPTKEDMIESLKTMNDSDKTKNIIYYKLSYDLLPDRLVINDFFNCVEVQLARLPDNLTVTGDLYIGNNILTELPNGLKVGGSLYVGDNQITRLPKDLIVKGDGVWALRNNIPEGTKKPRGVKGKLML